MVPTQKFQMPGLHAPVVQIQQLKAAGVTGGLPSANPQTKSPNTQGLPQVVTGLSVSKRNVSASQVSLTVSFAHNPGDPYFSTARVYIKYGSAAPILVSEGSKSPIQFTVPRISTPSTVIVVSAGNWGSTPISSSPARSIRLQ